MGNKTGSHLHGELWIMTDAVFVGYENNWFRLNGNSAPLRSFRTVEAANKWKAEGKDRDFVLVELE